MAVESDMMTKSSLLSRSTSHGIFTAIKSPFAAKFPTILSNKCQEMFKWEIVFCHDDEVHHRNILFFTVNLWSRRPRRINGIRPACLVFIIHLVFIIRWRITSLLIADVDSPLNVGRHLNRLIICQLAKFIS